MESVVPDEERTRRKQRLMKLVMERELFRYCGAMALIWSPEFCEKWNSRLEDPSHHLYLPWPEERRKWSFTKRQMWKIRYYARRTVESPHLVKGNKNMNRLMEAIPERHRSFVENHGREFQQWVYSDKARFLKYRGEGECWAVEGMVAAKEFMIERRKKQEESSWTPIGLRHAIGRANRY